MSEEVVVVTGASRGIGLATSLLFAQRGFRVAMLSRGGEALAEAVKQVSKAGTPAFGVACDVAIEADVQRACDEILSQCAAPVVIVNNAGVVTRNQKIIDTTTDAWDRVVDVNLRGSFLIARAFLPSMVARDKGRIIQVGSISSTLACPGAASYAASKWGVVGFCKSLAEELRGTGLQAIALLPGSVDTEMLVGSGYEPRMSATDVAKMIAFLALDAPAAMNGSAIEMFG